MADLTQLHAKDIVFTNENSRIQWRLSRWANNPTLYTLDCMTVAQLYTIPGLGKKSVNAIIETLAKFRNA
jgi:hypothetical protein